MGRLLGERLLYPVFPSHRQRLMAGAQQDRYDIVSHHDANVELRRTLHSIPPNAIVVCGRSSCSLVQLYLNDSLSPQTKSASIMTATKRLEVEKLCFNS